MEVLYKFTGAGEVVGVPARDITTDDVEYHAVCEANSKTTLPCYVKVDAVKPAKAPKATATDEAATAA